MSVTVLPAPPDSTFTTERAPQSAQAKKGHLDQIDLIRVLTFASVIAVHDISYTTDLNTNIPNVLLTLLHFTRSMFFFITGFVLVYTYRNRKLRTGHFIQRRLVLVGIPYLVWTVFYFSLQQVGGQFPQLPDALSSLLEDTVKGIGWYHLYFLLVSIQFYLLFPLVMAFLRATKRYHVVVLAVSAGLQIATTVALTYLSAPDPNTMFGKVWENAGSFVMSYQFYLIAGCIAAFHYEKFHAWVSSHSRLIIGLLLGTMVFSEAWYFVSVFAGIEPINATGVLQPEMIPWYSAVVLGMYLLGIAWSKREHSHPLLRRVIHGASTRSFGVFLVHPAMLWFFLWVDNGWFPAHLPGIWLPVAGYTFAVAGSLVFVELVIRSPLSSILIGRQRIPLTTKKAAALVQARAMA